VPISDECKETMLESLNDQAKGCEEIYKLHIPNSVVPALIFDPVLPGMKLSGSDELSPPASGAAARILIRTRTSHGESSNSNSLFLELGARALKFQGCGAESFGNILVSGETLEVDGVQHLKHVHGDV
jgi:hypothetical protein